MTFPVQREVGYVSHWLLRYLVVGEMRHSKTFQKGCKEAFYIIIIFINTSL